MKRDFIEDRQWRGPTCIDCGWPVTMGAHTCTPLKGSTMSVPDRTILVPKGVASQLEGQRSAGREANG